MAGDASGSGRGRGAVTYSGTDGPKQQWNLRKTPETLTTFLRSLADIPNVQAACRAAKVSPFTAYNWRKDPSLTVELDPADGPRPFHELWDECLQAGIDKLEEVAMKWAHGRLGEPVLHQGQLMFETEPVGDDEWQPVPADGIFEHMRPRKLKRGPDGQPIPLYVPTRNARMLELVLKAKKREEYGDKVDVTHKKGEGGVLVVQPTPVTPDEEAAYMEELSAQQAVARGEAGPGISAQRKPAAPVVAVRPERVVVEAAEEDPCA